MGLRPGHCYRSTKDRPYTRLAVRVHDKNYIGAAPGLKIRQFNMGNPFKNFSRILDLIVLEEVQIRDNAMESTRIMINKGLTKKVGKENYFMKIRAYPYHILRENKIAQGAGADRISTGMSHSFGTPIGRALRVKPGQRIISVLVDEAHTQAAKKCMLGANSKLPTKVKVKVHQDVQSIGTKPAKIREEKKEEEPKKEEAKKEDTASAQGKPEETKEKGKAAAKETPSAAKQAKEKK
ncbi:MAG: 50S ribosomal protein L16 [archaeon]|nr:50S ribosomal protein L16 [archaeon]